MKKIINGKIFDTDSMLKIYEHDCGLSTNDFNRHDSTLYYAKREGDNGLFMGDFVLAHWFYSTQELEILSREDALEWLERKKVDLDEVNQDFIKSVPGYLD